MLKRNACADFNFLRSIVNLGENDICLLRQSVALEFDMDTLGLLRNEASETVAGKVTNLLSKLDTGDFILDSTLVDFENRILPEIKALLKTSNLGCRSLIEVSISIDFNKFCKKHSLLDYHAFEMKRYINKCINCSLIVVKEFGGNMLVCDLSLLDRQRLLTVLDDFMCRPIDAISESRVEAFLGYEYICQ